MTLDYTIGALLTLGLTALSRLRPHLPKVLRRPPPYHQAAGMSHHRFFVRVSSPLRSRLACICSAFSQAAGSPCGGSSAASNACSIACPRRPKQEQTWLA